jgi:protein-S-isoprenylcysteine O-methyltransferase Ste14
MVVEVHEGQKFISTELYCVLRHPMYSGVLIMYLLTPIAFFLVVPGAKLPPLFRYISDYYRLALFYVSHFHGT